VRLNPGADAPAPRWRTKLERPEDLGALSEIVERLSRAGQPIPQRWVSERFGIPLPAEDEPILEAPAADALPPFTGAGPKKKRDGEPNNASNRSPSGTPRLTLSSRTLFGRSA
jgi:phage gp29-like protein